MRLRGGMAGGGVASGAGRDYTLGQSGRGIGLQDRYAGCPRVRCVFSDGGRQIRLEREGPPGQGAGTVEGASGSWRAVTRALRNSSHGIQTGLKTAVADLLHAAMPSDCRLCGGPMLGLSPVRFCDVCVERVRAQAEAREALCSRCGNALGMESLRFAASMGVAECTACQVTPPAFAKAVAFAPYHDEMREMLHALKFSGARRVAEHVLSEWLAEAVRKLEPDAGRDLVVVPVPLFRGRERKRGFNQAALLAEASVKRLKKVCPGWRLELRPQALLRVKDTRAMFALGPDQRRRNLEGAFKVGDAEAVRGREVLLIDDLLTTGATANMCAKVLLGAGAEKVWVATVARAQPESVQAVATSVARWDAPVVARGNADSVRDC
jgi:ComF family protein